MWDKHTARGKGKDTIRTLVDTCPDIGEQYYFSDGPGIVRDSVMEHFFSTTAWLPKQCVNDPFERDMQPPSIPIWNVETLNLL